MLYVYIEYNDNSVSEMNIKASTNIDTLKTYLRERVENYFHCPWNEIEAKFMGSDDELTDTYVHYDDTSNYLTWEIMKVETL